MPRTSWHYPRKGAGKIRADVRERLVMGDRLEEISDLLRHFDLALNTGSAELLLLRARTYLLELLRWRATDLGVDDATRASIWRLIREVFKDSRYATLRSHIGVVLDARNAIAHDLAVHLPIVHVEACAKIAEIPETDVLL